MRANHAALIQLIVVKVSEKRLEPMQEIQRADIKNINNNKILYMFQNISKWCLLHSPP